MKMVNIWSIEAHAIARDMALKKLDSQAEPTKEHLLKILLCDSCGSISHWIGELRISFSLKKVKSKEESKVVKTCNL